MNLALRTHQLPMVDHMLDVPRSAIWAGMGLGKTLAALYSIGLTQCVERDMTLILGPKRVIECVWPDEAKKWSAVLQSVEVAVVSGTPTARAKALKADANIFTLAYDNLPWLLAHLDGKWPFARVIADESTRLKTLRVSIRTSTKGKQFVSGQGGVRARSIAKVAHFKNLTRWSNLTGTPSPNGYLDLWGQTWFLDAGVRLGHTFGAYKERYFTNIAQGDQRAIWKLQPFAEQQINAKLSDLTLSMEAKDHFNLPPLISNTIYVELPAAARRLYRDMEKKLYAEIDGTAVEAFTAGAKSQKLLQMASGAVYLNPELGEAQRGPKIWKALHDAKIQALDSVLVESAGSPVLVAYYFRSDLERLLLAFPHGRLLDSDPQTIRDWNAGKIPLLFSHPKSAGHGLNLQDGGNILVFFSHDWNLEEYLQIIERIGPTRQAQSGHDRSVFVHYLVARGTVDEDVLARRETKREVQDVLMAAMKRRLAA
jgi:SNF2 family DNA or RNA helicase